MMNLFLELTENTIKGLPIAIAAIQSVIQEVSTGKAIGAGVAAGAAGAGTYALANHIAKNGLPKISIGNGFPTKTTPVPTQTPPAPTQSERDAVGNAITYGDKPVPEQDPYKNFMNNRSNPAPQQPTSVAASSERPSPFGPNTSTQNADAQQSKSHQFESSAGNNAPAVMTPQSAPVQSGKPSPFGPGETSGTTPQPNLPDALKPATPQPADPGYSGNPFDTGGMARDVGHSNTMRQVGAENKKFNDFNSKAQLNNPEITGQIKAPDSLTAGIVPSNMSGTELKMNLGLDPTKDFTKYHVLDTSGTFSNPTRADGIGWGDSLRDSAYREMVKNSFKYDVNKALGKDNSEIPTHYAATGHEDPARVEQLSVPKTPELPTMNNSPLLGQGGGTINNSVPGYFDTSSLTANMNDMPTLTYLPKLPAKTSNDADAAGETAQKVASGGLTDNDLNSTYFF